MQNSRVYKKKMQGLAAQTSMSPPKMGFDLKC